MVHANNCSSQVNVIAGLLRDFAAAMGQPVPDGKIYEFLFNSAVDGAPDCDGIVTYGYTSGESILNLDAGRPLTVRRADSTVNWPNLMRCNLCGALAALKVGMDILTRDEQVPLQRIYGHGGFFTTPQVGQRLLASALAAPVTVMETAGSGGPWGMRCWRHICCSGRTESVWLLPGAAGICLLSNGDGGAYGAGCGGF